MPTSSVVRPFKIGPNWDFWLENIPSGNPAIKSKKIPRRQKAFELSADNWWLTHSPHPFPHPHTQYIKRVP
jgi:hypothetical protein